MNAEQEMIEVTIQAFERVEYWQTVRMPKAEFEKLDAGLESDDRRERRNAEEKISAWLDFSDVCNATGFELEAFGPTKHDG